MSDRESRDQIAPGEAAYLLELTEIAVQADDLAGLAQGALPRLVPVLGATAAILCLEEPNPPFHSLFQAGIQADTLPLIKRICTEQFQCMPSRDEAIPDNRSPVPPGSCLSGLVLSEASHEKTGVLGPGAAWAGKAAPADSHGEDHRLAGLCHSPIS